MADRMTSEQRHRCMASIRSKDTKPEILVRRYLFARGLRYRIHVNRLPGSPDIVFRKYKTVVFVDGCFWHGHEGCRHYVLPKSNTEFWQAKVDRNRARDRRDDEALEKLGWRVIRFWECGLRPKDAALVNLDRLFREITGSTEPAHLPTVTPQSPSVAAEPGATYGA